MKNIEKRYVNASEIRLGSEIDKLPTLVGYAARFNSRSELLGDFYEVIQPGAFAQSLKTNDIRALGNHDDKAILGRTKAGTLRLKEDEQGLYFEVDLPDTSYARDLVESIRRGDIDGCSFGFVVEEDSWTVGDDKIPLRTLISCDLFEITPCCTFPAYNETSVAIRSLNDWRKAQGTPVLDRAKRSLQLLERLA